MTRCIVLVEKHFFFGICGRSLATSSFKHTGNAIDVPSLLKVIDEQSTLRIPKYGGQNLTCWCLRLWSLWTAFTCCYPLSWLLICLRSDVVDPCFIHCHIFIPKLLFVALKQLQKGSESSMCCCVWLTVSKRWTHLNTAFLLTNVHAKSWIHCLLISSTPLLSSATSIYIRLKRVDEVFWCFPGQMPNLGDLSVQHHLCLYKCI